MTDRSLRRTLFLLFFTSGFCGLLYQVVWVRIASAAFGVITPILSVVISVFMAGLFLGSWGAARLAERLSTRRRSAAWLYAAAELLIGAGAFAVPALLSGGHDWLLRAGETESIRYLVWSAVIVGASILPWCVAMGATFPLMMAYIRQQRPDERTGFSFLYVANVIGAMAGTLTTALVLVEALGFRRTLLVAAALNVAIAAAAALLARRSGAPAPSATRDGVAGSPSHSTEPRRAGVIEIVLFTTGFTSMAMEVAWTRAFTAVLSTQVYAFASLLFCYLLATWVGSLRYRRDLATGRVAATSRLLAWLVGAAALPLVVNDPRTFAVVERAVNDVLADVLRVSAALLGILPFCAVLGYLTPQLVDRASDGAPGHAGRSYAVNVLGCIVGPLVASYLLLPALGVKHTLVLLAAPYALLLLLHRAELAARATRRIAFAGVALLVFAGAMSLTYEEHVQGFRGEGLVRRDHTATTIAYGTGMDRRLLVNGVGITHLSTITKMMAHLPLAAVREPRSALAICFGMGTTYRSLMSWDVSVTAVELVPGVKESFSYFFDDAARVLQRPNGKIVVDDGRRFLQRTGETFDVITLDPPPPVEAAASSLLYSEEFYAAAKARLREGGILQQWIPVAEPGTTAAVTRSLLRSFPYVRMFSSYERWGYHFLASMEPIVLPGPEALARRLPPRAAADLVEWTPTPDPQEPIAIVLAQEVDPREFARGDGARVTDDHPYNEYYLLRRAWSAATRWLTPAAERQSRRD